MNYRSSSLVLVMLGLWGCDNGNGSPFGQGGSAGVPPGTGGNSSAQGGSNPGSGGAVQGGSTNPGSGGSTNPSSGGSTSSGGTSGGSTTAVGGSSGAATGGSSGGMTSQGQGGSVAGSGGSAQGGSSGMATGGTTAAGGTGGGASGGGTGGGSSGACPAGKTIFCEDFESYGMGAAMKSDRWTPVTQNGSLQIDGTHARGKQALHVHTQDNGRAYIQVSPFAPPSNSFYGRMHLWVTAFPTAPNYAHYTLVELSGTGNQSVVRPIGGQYIQDQSANMWGPGSDVGPTGDWTNWKPSAKAEGGKWVCMEWQMAAADNEIKIWIDGVAKPDLTVSTKSHGGTQVDFVFPTFNNIWFGWWLYQGGTTPKEFDLWMDDIALSSERLGCE